MSNQENRRPWEELQILIENSDSGRLSKFLESISPSETARAVSHLSEFDQSKLLELLNPQDAAELITDLPDEQAADLMEAIPAGDAKNIVNIMSVDEQADILGDMQTDEAQAILDKMLPEDAEKTRQILRYPEDSAGGIMDTDFLSFREEMTVQEVLEDLENHREKYAKYSVQYAYVISRAGKLSGVLKIRELPFSARNRAISSLIVANPIKVEAETSLDEMIQIFEKNAFLGIPVTTNKGRIVGVVRRDKVLEAAGDRDKDTYLKASGIIGGEELRTMPLWQRSGRRLSWLSVNIFLNILAASVIAMYQETLSAVIALAVFLPIISDMSGCSGNQAVAVSIRELTLGLVKPFDLLRVLIKEMGVGIINGIILGILLGAVAFLWKRNPYLGIVVGGAMAINTVVAVCLGGLIPLVLQRFGKDPALASGPILTTVTDMCGFLLALGFATLLLPLLN